MARILFVVGTRPEAIKLAPLVESADLDPRFEPILVTTGQHREMVDQVLEVFSLRVDEELKIDRAEAPDLASMTAVLLRELTAMLRRHQPDCVVVQGDTTSAYIGALAAFYQNIPVVHVEAGLRSGDMRSPFPEEMNRRAIAPLAALHLCPTAGSEQNLLLEGVSQADIRVTGNTVIDALHRVVGRVTRWESSELHWIESETRRIILVTAHRRESWGEPLALVGEALTELARRHPDIVIVFPIHRNPLVRDTMMPLLHGVSNIVVIEPLGYADFSRLLSLATIVVTDSGGVQEEAPSLGIPVLVLRDNTERPEAVDAGAARLVGTDRDLIVSEVERLLTDPAAYAEMSCVVSPYGDGDASPRCLDAIYDLLNSRTPANAGVSSAQG